MKRPLFLAAILSTILISLVLTGRVQAEKSLPRFEPVVCSEEVSSNEALLLATKAQVDCGLLIISESENELDGTTLQLPVVILRSLSDDPAPDPILFLRGGPGATYLGSLHSLAIGPFIEERDLIILEQRGNLQALPNLDCDQSLLVDDALPCLEELTNRGLALNRYNTQALVTDIDSLRQALGYERWNLFGESYSTRLVLLAMTAYPSTIRSAVVDSAHPPSENVYESSSKNFSRALDTFFDECKNDPDCDRSYPELERRFYSLIEEFNRNPVRVVFTNRDTGVDTEATLDGNWLLAQTYDALYGHLLNEEDPLSYWPLLIDQLSQGNLHFLEPWVAGGIIDWESTLAFGMYFSVMCQDEYAVAEPEILTQGSVAFPELVQWADNALGRSVCEAWEVGSNPPWAGQVVESDVPTLILSGSHAPVLDPAWGKTAAETLPNSFYYEFPGMGQWISSANPCAQNIIASFLSDPTSEPDSTCLLEQTGLTIVTLKDITLEPGITRYYLDIHSKHPHRYRQIALGFSLILFAGQLVFLCIAIIRPLINGRRALVAQLVAGLAAVLNLGFSVMLSQIVKDLSANQPLVLRFGLLNPEGTLLIIPVLTNIIAAVVMVISFLIWIRKSWTKGMRLLYSLVALATVTYSSLMAYWGFLLLP